MADKSEDGRQDRKSALETRDSDWGKEAEVETGSNDLAEQMEANEGDRGWKIERKRLRSGDCTRGKGTMAEAHRAKSSSS